MAGWTTRRRPAQAGPARPDDGAEDAGAAYLLLMNANGTVKSDYKISVTQGGFTGQLSEGDKFGHFVSGGGDIDRDGVLDLLIAATGDQHRSLGAIYVVFLNADGSVKAHQKINEVTGGLAGIPEIWSRLGYGLNGIGDVDCDSIPDLMVSNSGILLLLLNADGTVKRQVQIDETVGNLHADFHRDNFYFSNLSTAFLGDPDGDGTGGTSIWGEEFEDEFHEKLNHD